jgi:hypothetical protein
VFIIVYFAIILALRFFSHFKVIQFLNRQRLAPRMDASSLHSLTLTLLNALAPYELQPQGDVKPPVKTPVLSPAGRRLLDALMSQWKCLDGVNRMTGELWLFIYPI